MDPTEWDGIVSRVECTIASRGCKTLPSDLVRSVGPCRSFLTPRSAANLSAVGALLSNAGMIRQILGCVAQRVSLPVGDLHCRGQCGGEPKRSQTGARQQGNKPRNWVVEWGRVEVRVRLMAGRVLKDSRVLPWTAEIGPICHVSPDRPSPSPYGGLLCRAHCMHFHSAIDIGQYQLTSTKHFFRRPR